MLSHAGPAFEVADDAVQPVVQTVVVQGDAARHNDKDHREDGAAEPRRRQFGHVVHVVQPAHGDEDLIGRK